MREVCFGAIVAALASVACRGEAVGGETLDSAASPTDGVPADTITLDTFVASDAGAAEAAPPGDCALEPGELLTDPSFEAWSAGRSSAWRTDGTGKLEQLVPAAHCALAARVDVPQYLGVTQDKIAFKPPLPKGTVVNVRARVKWISGASNPYFFFYVKPVGAAEKSVGIDLTDWATDGLWHDNSGKFTLEVDTEAIQFHVLNRKALPLVFGIDGTSMTVTKP